MRNGMMVYLKNEKQPFKKTPGINKHVKENGQTQDKYKKLNERSNIQERINWNISWKIYIINKS